jgi:hypothetical protein
MYHPFALDQIRVQQEDLVRRAAAQRLVREAMESRPRGDRRRWWPRPRPSLLRLAFTDTVMRPVTTPCVD